MLRNDDDHEAEGSSNGGGRVGGVEEVEIITQGGRLCPWSGNKGVAWDLHRKRAPMSAYLTYVLSQHRLAIPARSCSSSHNHIVAVGENLLHRSRTGQRDAPKYGCILPSPDLTGRTYTAFIR